MDSDRMRKLIHGILQCEGEQTPVLNERRKQDCFMELNKGILKLSYVRHSGGPEQDINDATCSLIGCDRAGHRERSCGPRRVFGAPLCFSSRPENSGSFRG
jgi:hypothetical protein